MWQHHVGPYTGGEAPVYISDHHTAEEDGGQEADPED